MAADYYTQLMEKLGKQSVADAIGGLKLQENGVYPMLHGRMIYQSWAAANGVDPNTFGAPPSGKPREIMDAINRLTQDPNMTLKGLINGLGEIKTGDTDLGKLTVDMLTAPGNDPYAQALQGMVTGEHGSIAILSKDIDLGMTPSEPTLTPNMRTAIAGKMKEFLDSGKAPDFFKSVAEWHNQHRPDAPKLSGAGLEAEFRNVYDALASGKPLRTDTAEYKTVRDYVQGPAFQTARDFYTDMELSGKGQGPLIGSLFREDGLRRGETTTPAITVGDEKIWGVLDYLKDRPDFMSEGTYQGRRGDIPGGDETRKAAALLRGQGALQTAESIGSPSVPATSGGRSFV